MYYLIACDEDGGEEELATWPKKRPASQVFEAAAAVCDRQPNDGSQLVLSCPQEGGLLYTYEGRGEWNGVGCY